MDIFPGLPYVHTTSSSDRMADRRITQVKVDESISARFCALRLSLHELSEQGNLTRGRLLRTPCIIFHVFYRIKYCLIAEAVNENERPMPTKLFLRHSMIPSEHFGFANRSSVV
jgi:hypothetical protein